MKNELEIRSEKIEYVKSHKLENHNLYDLKDFIISLCGEE